jgi:hypothetical protein
VAGSGKSTAIRKIIGALEVSGHQVDYWRFRTLRCFRYLQPSRGHGSGPPAASGASPLRWTGYKRRPLTAHATLTYLARIAAFTLFRWTDRESGYRVSNRYFYDNFPQFTIETARQRFYRWVLRRATPKPDLALLMVASVETLAARRPSYSREYFHELAIAYREIGLWSDDLIEISTEAGPSAVNDVAQVVLQRIARDKRQ